MIIFKCGVRIALKLIRLVLVKIIYIYLPVTFISQAAGVNPYLFYVILGGNLFIIRYMCDI